MNNENQTNPNNNLGDIGATSLGAAPEMPNNVPNENLTMPQNPTAPAPAASQPEAPSVASDLANPVMVEASPNPSATPVDNLDSNNVVNPTIENNQNGGSPVGVDNLGTNNNAENLEPIAQPIPGTATPTDNNVNSNAFVESQKMENVGTDVPNKPDKGKKKGMSKVLFIIVIILLLGAIAYGVWRYLSLGNTAKTKGTVTLKNLELEVNQSLPANIEDYATFNGVAAKDCRLITANVDITKAGSYEYTINCGNDTYTGKINVINNATLLVNTNTIYTNILAEGATNNNLTADKFVDATTCTGTDCTYAFDESFDLNASLKVAGNYNVPIKVTDSTGTTANVNANLRVFEDLKVFASCRNEEAKTTDKFAIKTDNTFADYAVRTQDFSFATDEEYQAAVGSKGEIITYNNVTGKATYDDQNRTLTIETELTIDALNTEAGGTFPTDFVGINTYYANKAYSCTIDMNGIVNP